MRINRKRHVSREREVELICPVKLLKQFVPYYSYSPAPLRPNTDLRFCLVNPLSPPLTDSSPPSIPHAWATLLHPYQGGTSISVDTDFTLWGAN